MKLKPYLKSALIGSFSLFSLLAQAETPISSDDALKLLQEGNQRFMVGAPTRPNQDVAHRQKLAQGQHPFAAFVSCADSRVSPEIIFDRGLGDLFIVRVAGNVVNTDQIGSTEYGVEHLHAPLLVVMGHTKCGAVAAVVQGAEVHGNIPEAVKNIGLAAEKVKTAQPGSPMDQLIAKTVEANVWLSIDQLFEKSSIVRHLVKTQQLKVVGAIYDLESGQVKWLGTHPEQARLLVYTTGESTVANHHSPAK